MYFTKGLLLATLCVFVRTVIAQENGNSTGWQKIVTRDVQWTEIDTKRLITPKEYGDTHVLTEMLARTITSDIPTYNILDYRFTNKQTKEEKLAVVKIEIDSIIVFDPVTGEEVTNVRKIPFPHWDIKRFRIVESWANDVANGRTSIKTLGIIPLIDLYSDDGLLMGRKPLVLFKYSDILPILREYEQYHPENSPFVKFWNGQFEREEKQETEENISK